MRTRSAAVVVLAVLALAPLAAQTLTRLATSLAIVGRYPTFFHGKAISIVATPAFVQGSWRVAIGASQTAVIVPHAAGAPPSTESEFHGVLYDLGRFAPDDSRVSLYGLKPIVETVTGDRWPTRETLFAIVDATWREPPDPAAGLLRAVALMPARYEGRTVTLRGRFRGRNLYGDLPAWPRQTSDDFVLQLGDAAVWVTGIKPKGKGFDLDPTTRRDIGRWLEAAGVVHLEAGLPRLEARSLQAVAPAEEPIVDAPPVIAAEPAPTIVFSAPLDGQTDVWSAATVRIQFSRDMADASFDGHVHVTYGAGTTVKPPAFTVVYTPQNLGLTVTFAEPLAADAAVTVELGDGITARDGVALAKTTISFRTAR